MPELLASLPVCGWPQWAESWGCRCKDQEEVEMSFLIHIGRAGAGENTKQYGIFIHSSIATSWSIPRETKSGQGTGTGTDQREREKERKRERERGDTHDQ